MKVVQLLVTATFDSSGLPSLSFVFLVNLKINLRKSYSQGYRDGKSGVIILQVHNSADVAIHSGYNDERKGLRMEVARLLGIENEM